MDVAYSLLPKKPLLMSSSLFVGISTFSLSCSRRLTANRHQDISAESQGKQACHGNSRGDGMTCELPALHHPRGRPTKSGIRNSRSLFTTLTIPHVEIDENYRKWIYVSRCWTITNALYDRSVTRLHMLWSQETECLRLMLHNS